MHSTKSALLSPLSNRRYRPITRKSDMTFEIPLALYSLLHCTRGHYLAAGIGSPQVAVIIDTTRKPGLPGESTDIDLKK